MKQRETAHSIDADAATWVARIDAAGDDATLQAELAEWLGDDARRRGAYFRASAAWEMLDRASVLGSGRIDVRSAANAHYANRLTDDVQAENAERDTTDLGQDPDNGDARSRRHLLRWGGGAIAATLVAGVTGITIWPQSPEHIETKLGEIRRIPLADGSMASVNTATKLAFDFKPELRRVALDDGEAWFKVAKDTARPFIVEAGDVRAKAVGTAFSVRKTEAGILVQVTEGRVAVWRVGDEAQMQFVEAGSRAMVNAASNAAQVTQASPEIDRSLAWRQGEIAFDGDTLTEAAAEFNRYNQIQITIEDPALGAERLVGRFRTDEPDAFARAASSMLGASAQYSDTEITLSR